MDINNIMESLIAFETNYKKDYMVEFTKEHLEIPVFLISVYLVIVFYIPGLFEKPFYLKPFMAMWNLTLAVFSMIGLSRIAPALLSLYNSKGLTDSICTGGQQPDLPDWFDGACGLWMMFFVYSKLFELMDTVFLVLGKKPVIFLHWFHHVTVLMFCWYSLATTASTGIWFAAMNFFVHSIMYLYYFLMLCKPLRPVLKLLSPIITTIQILQMVGGLVVSILAAMEGFNGRPCNVTSANWKLGLAMYLCYFVLFSALFNAKYIAPMFKKTTTRALTPSVCSATDSAGMFRGSSHTNISSLDKPEAGKPKAE